MSKEKECCTCASYSPAKYGLDDGICKLTGESKGYFDKACESFNRDEWIYPDFYKIVIKSRGADPSIVERIRCRIELMLHDTDEEDNVSKVYIEKGFDDEEGED
jgi:hypothetical protein